MPTLLRCTRSKNFLLPVTLALMILADYLFYAYPLGWDTALFLGILAAAITLRSPNLWKKNPGRIILALTALILLSLVEQPTTLAILMSLLTLGSLLLIAKTGFTTSITDWLARWSNLLITLPLPALFDAKTSVRWLRKHPRKGAAAFLFPFRWIIPLAAGLVFLLLFIIANPILQKWATSTLNDLFHILRWLPDYLRPSRILLWFLTGLISHGLLRHRPRTHRKTIHINITSVRDKGT